MAAALPAAGEDLGRPGQHTWMHALVRWLFITVSLAFLAAVLLAPLATVFAMALAKGLAPYLGSFTDPDTLAALRLPLT
ncbi:MAG: sulfate/thiosulfate ABC transporter permease CysW, partial [Gammaproteobacteria bacterium]|nr:sulfate/thiosulfate ABC transporter permease CysW [Gammaproteobacteria bacterium]